MSSRSATAKVPVPVCCGVDIQNLGGFATSADPVKELRGGGLRGPGESWGALPGTSGALRGSPGELSLGARGRRFGSSGGVPGRAFQELKRGVPLEPKNSFPLRRWMFFGRFQTPLQPQPELAATVPKNVVHLPPTSRQNPSSGGGPYNKKHQRHPRPTTRR